VNYLEDFFIQNHPVLSSTQDQAKDLIAEKKGIRLGTVISADMQTNGKGRYDRKWISESGNIYITIILPSSENDPLICYAAGIAVRQSIKQLFPNLEPKLKWVNDILIEEQKVSGILLEKFNDFLLVGIGINIIHNSQIEALQSSGLSKFGPIEKDTLLATVLKNFKEKYNLLNQGAFNIIRNEWTKHAYKLGEEIKVNYPHAISETGIMKGIDEDGNLILQTSSELKKIRVGELFSL